MEDERSALTGAAAGFRIADVALQELDSRQGPCQVLATAAREVVEDAHAGALLEQGVDEVRADEARAAGHESELSRKDVAHGRPVLRP